MRLFRPSTWAFLLLAPLTACSSSGGDGASSLFITSCSLGCSSGEGGDQVFCQIVNTARNQEISIQFNDPVDPASLNSSSFRVLDTTNGSTPVGTFFVDPTNPRRLVFRPALTFGLDGTPVFGFAENTAYQITLPGLSLGGESGGPYIESTSGRRNDSPMECTVLTSLGLVDLVPGAPTVEVFVEVLTGDEDAMGNPLTVTMSLDDAGILDERVYRFSPITMRFADVMNPATMADPLTRTSSFVFVSVDEDGDLTTDDDRGTVPGSFTVDVDQDLLITTMTFDHETLNSDGSVTETLGFPSSGEDQMDPRKIALRFTNTVADLAGNKLVESSEGLTLGFVSEAVPIPPMILPGGVEDEVGIDPFTNGAETFEFSNSDLSDYLVGNGETSNEAADYSGAFWGNGRLAPGLGGGSGRLGDLVIENGDVVTLSTDSQVFPLTIQVRDLIQNGNASDAITIENGVFEFGSIEIQAGGRLVLEGEVPARIFSRGEVNIAEGGVLDLSGGTPEAHNSEMPEPMVDWLDDLGGVLEEAQVPGQGGPGGGDGGFGGTRHGFDATDIQQQGLIAAGGIGDDELPGGWVITDRNGRAGEEVRGFDETGTVVSTDVSTPGVGGDTFPSDYPLNVAIGLWGDGQWNSLVVPEFEADESCLARMVGGVGSGGAYATDGVQGAGTSTEPLADFPLATTPSNDPPVTDPGTSDLATAEPPSLLNTGYDARRLNFDPAAGVPRYNLRGGAGGGGGGNHPFNSYSDAREGVAMNDCDDGSASFNPGATVALPWQDHSGAAGGGGGGAVEITSGTRVTVEGVIDASGGDGGSASTTVALRGRHAAPGGGGSGGAVLLQGRDIAFGAMPGRIDVSGGSGGAWVDTSFGGDGGAGLVRLEYSSGTALDGSSDVHDAIAPSLLPYDPMGGSLGTGSVAILSPVPATDDWSEPTFLPDAYSASVSCWLQPPGNFFSIGFQEDTGDVETTDPADLAWNMEVILVNGMTIEYTRPFRGVNGVVHEFFNNINFDLDDLPMGEDTPSVLAIRFQGARSSSELEDPCGVGTGAPILPTSVTPWVDHPAELNPGPGDSWPEPNYFRFAVFFDPSAGNASAAHDEFSRALRGVTNLWIRADPD